MFKRHEGPGTQAAKLDFISDLSPETGMHMRWEDFRTSSNVEDRRGMRVPGGAGGLGMGTLIILGLIGWAFGIDPRILIGGAEMLNRGGGGSVQQQQGREGTPQDEMGRFAAAILGNTEDVWKEVLPAQVNKQYRPPKLVLFSGATRSGCGNAQSAMGPFYCPLDQTVYLDLSFFQEMQQRFRAGGDFAYAYVITHEVGHHVENLLEILPKVQQRQQEVGEIERNQLSVRVELMADCLAGVWAHHSQQRWQSLEQGDIEEAIKAAQAIGDDRLQRQSQGMVVPDSFTHGSSAQRVRWLTTGLKTGQIQACDTFRTSQL
jgi:predicted metalloprotease